jgi:hypothetical protein
MTPEFLTNAPPSPGFLGGRLPQQLNPIAKNLIDRASGFDINV